VTSRRRALIVANDQYENAGLARLHSPAADADALSRVLGDPQVGGFDVHVVRNEPAHVIGTHIEDLFSDSRPDDVLLLHFSCHGLKNESGELFFAASGTRPDRLGSTAVAADFVQRCMRASRSRSIVLLLDCCYGGAFSQGVAVRATGGVTITESFPGGRLGGGRGRAVITASSSMEYAFEGDRLADDKNPAASVFTSALVEGLATGEADRDEDGWVSLNELYEYVFDRVRERNPHQTPSRDVEMQGELYIARSGRLRVRPLPIPADLRAAMADENMFSRLGAVMELRLRLASENLPLAAGACEALQEIAANDIQYVAEAATTALDDVQTRVAEPQVRFGPVVAGTDPGTRAVRLLGPPLARACTVQVSDGWIRAAQTADGLLVSVDTGRAGAYRGGVTLKGPLGEVVVPVEVDVTAAREPDPPVVSTPVVSTPVVSTPVTPLPVAPERVVSQPVAPERAAPRPVVREPVVAQQAAPSSRPLRPIATSATAPVVEEQPDEPVPAWWRSVMAYEALSVGAVMILLGVVLLGMRDEAAQADVVIALIALYAAHWLYRACVPETRGIRRLPAALIGTAGILTVGWLVALPLQYLAYWSINRTPLYAFWILAGLLEIVAVLALGPGRVLEWVAAGWGVAFGLVLFYLVAGEVGGSLAPAFGFYGVGLGVVWVLAGVQRRKAAG
jgi:hypothetical protein